MSGILLPESVLQDMRDHQKKIEQTEHESQVRFSIEQGLKSLALHLGYYCQTTHGSVGPFTIEQIAEQLVECWHKPTSYNISELAQRAEQLGGRPRPSAEPIPARRAEWD